MSERSDERYQKIMELRAERKGVSLEEAEKVERPEPLFVQAAKITAERLGITPEKVLEADLQRMKTYPYPTPDCLTPDEIEDLIDAEDRIGSLAAQGGISSPPETVGLAEARLAHLESCDACRTLRAVSRPKQEYREKFERLLEIELGRLREESKPNQKFRVAAIMFVSNAVCAIAPPFVFLLCYVLVINPLNATQHSSWLLWAATIITLGLAGFLTFRYYRLASLYRPGHTKAESRKPSRTGKWNFLRSSSGSLVGGLVVGMIIGWYSFEQNRAKQELVLDVAVSGLENLAVSSIENREQTGEFSETATITAQPVSLKTEIVSQKEVVYEADASGLPGKLVAEVNPNMGRIYWDVGEEHQLKAKLLSGTVEEISNDNFVLKSPDGKSSIKIKYDSSIYRPAINSRVAIALDADSLIATKIIDLK